VAIWRFEHRHAVDPRGLNLKKKSSLYFYENFYVTTSGNYQTQALIRFAGKRLSLPTSRVYLGRH